MPSHLDHNVNVLMARSCYCVSVCEQQLEQGLQQFGEHWELNPGDGAFYGPKVSVVTHEEILSVINLSEKICLVNVKTQAADTLCYFYLVLNESKLTPGLHILEPCVLAWPVTTRDNATRNETRLSVPTSSSERFITRR